MPLGTITLGTTETYTLTIPASGSSSNSHRTHGMRGGSFQLPAAMTGTAVTVQVSNDGTNFSEVIEEGGEVNPVTVAGNAAFVLPEKTFSFQYFRLTSNGTEAAARDIQVFVRG